MEKDSKVVNHHGHTTIKEYKFVYNWKIEDFKNINFEGPLEITSPEYIIDWKGQIFKFLLKLEGFTSNENFFRYNYSLKKDQSITPITGDELPKHRIRYFVLNKEGKEISTSYQDGQIFLQSNNPGLEHLLVNGYLNIIYEIYFIDIVNELCPNSVQNGSENRLKEFDDFERFLGDKKFSDMKILVDGQQFYVHKVFLSRSDVFTAMFEHNMKENEENVIPIEDISYEVMNEILRFIYVGKVNNIESLALDLFVAADKYNLQRLKDMCENVLLEKLKNENLAEIIKLVDHCKAPRLRSAAIRLIKLYGLQFLKTKELPSVLTFLNTCEEIKDDDFQNKKIKRTN